MAVPYRSSPRAEVSLPPAMHAELAAELEPGERVLWSAAACMRKTRARALLDLAFPLAWNGFVVFLVMLAARRDAATWLGAVPLLAMSLPLFAKPLAACVGKSVFHAVTDRRVLLFEREGLFAIDRDDPRARAAERQVADRRNFAAVAERLSERVRG